MIAMPQATAAFYIQKSTKYLMRLIDTEGPRLTRILGLGKNCVT